MTPFNARRRLLAAIAATCASAMLSLAIPLQAWAALSASVADLTMAALPYSHAQQAAAGTVSLTATDTGSCILFICSNNGWHVTIQASDFAYTGPNLGTAIPAANLSITQAHPPTRLSGQAIDAQGGPRVPASNSTGTLDVPRETLEAADNFGLGSYRQLIDVSLIVPGQSRAGTYRTTLTVTISAGP
jgi:spore coat protein U-like protein